LKVAVSGFRERFRMPKNPSVGVQAEYDEYCRLIRLINGEIDEIADTFAIDANAAEIVVKPEEQLDFLEQDGILLEDAEGNEIGGEGVLVEDEREEYVLV
jgi:hypothetical protein